MKATYITITVGVCLILVSIWGWVSIGLSFHIINDPWKNQQFVFHFTRNLFCDIAGVLGIMTGIIPMPIGLSPAILFWFALLMLLTLTLVFGNYSHIMIIEFVSIIFLSVVGIISGLMVVWLSLEIHVLLYHSKKSNQKMSSR